MKVILIVLTAEKKFPITTKILNKFLNGLEILDLTKTNAACMERFRRFHTLQVKSACMDQYHEAETDGLGAQTQTLGSLTLERVDTVTVAFQILSKTSQIQKKKLRRLC